MAQLLETLTNETMGLFCFVFLSSLNLRLARADSLTAEMSGNGALRNRRSSNQGGGADGRRNHCIAQGTAPHAAPPRRRRPPTTSKRPRVHYSSSAARPPKLPLKEKDPGRRLSSFSCPPHHVPSRPAALSCSAAARGGKNGGELLEGKREGGWGGSRHIGRVNLA